MIVISFPYVPVDKAKSIFRLDCIFNNNQTLKNCGEFPPNSKLGLTSMSDYRKYPLLNCCLFLFSVIYHRSCQTNTCRKYYHKLLLCFFSKEFNILCLVHLVLVNLFYLNVILAIYYIGCRPKCAKHILLNPPWLLGNGIRREQCTMYNGVGSWEL